MITGAASGFGAAAADRFASLGATLALSDITAPHHPGALTASLDVTQPDDHAAHIDTILDRFGRLDIAINNAGVAGTLAPITQTDIAEYDRIFAVNTRGVFLGMQAQLRVMIPQKYGVILNIASAAGLVGAGQLAAYSASKHAVVGLTRSAADEVARHGIRVNALCPSFAPTPLFQPMVDQMAARSGTNPDSATAQITSRIPMRRLAQVDEVVQAMVWACAPDNSFMTGQALAIDGGLTAI